MPRLKHRAVHDYTGLNLMEYPCRSIDVEKVDLERSYVRMAVVQSSTEQRIVDLGFDILKMNIRGDDVDLEITSDKKFQEVASYFTNAYDQNGRLLRGIHELTLM